MDLKELKKLISLMNENELVELEISEKGRRFVLKKASSHHVVQNHVSHLPVASNGTGPLPIAQAPMPAAKTVTAPQPR